MLTSFELSGKSKYLQTLPQQLKTTHNKKNGKAFFGITEGETNITQKRERGGERDEVTFVVVGKEFKF